MAEEKLIFTTEQDQGGRGAWWRGRFLFWGTVFRRSIIALERTREKINRVGTVIVWLIIFAGWLAIILWVVGRWTEIVANPFLLIFFWKKFNPLVLIFLLSLWFDLFFIYRSSEKRAALKKINYRLFETKRDSARGQKKYNVAAGYSEASRRAVADAYLLARRLNQSEVAVIHLFRVMLKVRDIQNLLIRLNIDAKKLVELVDRRLLRLPARPARTPLVLSAALQELLVAAFADAGREGQDSVDFFNIILFCYDADAALGEILYELEIDRDKIINAVAWFRVNRRLVEHYRQYRSLAILKPASHMNRSYTAIATPTLDHFSHDLTASAKYGGLDLCIGRETEIAAIFESFIGGHNGVLLVGPVGVGKSTIIGGLAQLMVAEKVPSFLKDKRLVELDVSRLVAGASPTQAEERLLSSINEISRSGNIILYLANIENLIGISAGSQESLDLSEVLSEALSRHNLFCLSSATTENYSRYIEHKAIGNTMTTIGIKEPEVNAAIQILESKVGWLEAKYDVYIVYSAIEQAVAMSMRYLHDKALPLKAIELLEKAAQLTLQRAKAAGPATAAICSREEVALAISALTGIPVSKIGVAESAKLLNLEKDIHRRLVGQEEAVAAVSASLRRARVELKDRQRPIASFLFLGPTGVGKTELAKSVSEVYFGDEDYLVRLDMSEYQSADSIRKMIGDVDGTFGYLTEAVRKKPFSLILLDEIEKANPDILNLFLQLLDDGRLTDGQGRTISFAESIIIATSNIGAVYIQEQIKAKAPLNLIRQELVDNQLNKYLRPELINRFDGIIVFKPLSEEDTFTITTLLLKKIKKSLAEKGIGLKADKDGVVALARAGYDPKFGARPLRRLLQDKVEDQIANYLLTGQLKRRDTVIINQRAEIEISSAPEL